MIRLFVALDFPPDIRDRLGGLGGGVPGARWIDADSLHLTLRFIGELPEDRAADLALMLAGVEAPAFDLTLDGVGVFGSPRKPRLLWAGVERNEALNRLQGKLESVMIRAGLAAEEHRFTPHVTLARLTNAPAVRIGRFIEERSLFRAGPFPVDHFTLFESLLGKEQAVYRPLREYPLAV
jgi:RNA 2',3'-cyclic 3'-phosphodiesterase